MNDVSTQLKSKDLHEKLRDKVQQSFLDLIGPEAFDDMVNKEVTAFFETEVKLSFQTVSGQGYGAKSSVELQTDMTPFRQLIWTEVGKLVRAKLEDELIKQGLRDEVNTEWDNNGGSRQVAKLGERGEATVQALVPLFVGEMMKNMFGANIAEVQENIIMDIKNRMNNGQF